MRLILVILAVLVSSVRAETAVYLSVPWSWAYTAPGQRGGPEPLPLGVTPAITDGGGRYLDATGQWDSWWVGGYHGPQMEWDLTKLRVAFERMPPGLLYVINVEHWPLDIRHHPREQVEATIDRIRRLLADIREINPTIQLGFYAYTPPREYWIPVELSRAAARRPVDFPWLLRATQAHGRWVQAAQVNSRMLEGPGGLDASMPSLYRFYHEQDIAYITEHVKLAVQTSHEKPVIGFMWPSFHDRGQTPGAPVGEKAWRDDVRQALESGARAVIVWSGHIGWSVESLRPHLEWALDEARQVRMKKDTP